jgi:hypothetical protein
MANQQNQKQQAELQLDLQSKQCRQQQGRFKQDKVKIQLRQNERFQTEADNGRGKPGTNAGKVRTKYLEKGRQGEARSSNAEPSKAKSSKAKAI